jgi:hypothetical protein
MKPITKRELIRNPSLVPHLKPGESSEVKNGDSNITVARRKKRLLSVQKMEAELDALAKKCPPMDCQAVLNDLRS